VITVLLVQLETTKRQIGFCGSTTILYSEPPFFGPSSGCHRQLLTGLTAGRAQVTPPSQPLHSSTLWFRSLFVCDLAFSFQSATVQLSLQNVNFYAVTLLFALGCPARVGPKSLGLGTTPPLYCGEEMGRGSYTDRLELEFYSSQPKSESSTL
jgi:hypothetical protein